MNLVRATLAVLVVAVLGCAALGIGMGESSADRKTPPSAKEIAAAKQRIAAGSAGVERGRAAFEADGCDRCHAIAAIGADGRLGPRLDTLDEDADHNLESIADPRDDITDGYPSNLMPTDYADRLGDARVQALADFVTAVSGGKAGDGDGGGRKGRGRGRGRGRGGSGGD